MIEGIQSESWLKIFPGLDKISNVPLRSELEQLKVMHIEKGKTLFREGDECQGYVLVISGSVSVHKMDAEGHEILLYRVANGQTCMLTTICLLGMQPYPAEGVAETDVELLMLPSHFFERLLKESETFRRYAMSHIGNRICDMMLLIEDVAFGRMDMRLARLLLHRLSLEGESIHCTHQELASELGTAREVISRMLKRFESNGWVKLNRGVLHIQDITALEKLAHGKAV